MNLPLNLSTILKNSVFLGGTTFVGGTPPASELEIDDPCSPGTRTAVNVYMRTKEDYLKFRAAWREAYAVHVKDAASLRIDRIAARDDERVAAKSEERAIQPACGWFPSARAEQRATGRYLQRIRKASKVWAGAESAKAYALKQAAQAA